MKNKGKLLRFDGSFIADQLTDKNKYMLYESYLEGGDEGIMNPFFWPKYSVTYLDLASAKRMEQKGNNLLPGEYVGPGKIIKGKLLAGTYYNNSEEPIDPERIGLVLKIVKDDDSSIIAIEILDNATREVVRIDPNEKIVIC